MTDKTELGEPFFRTLSKALIMTDKTELGEPEIQEFINYLAVKERVSA